MKLKKFIGTLIITIIFILTIAQVKIYSADQSYILGATNIREDKGAYQISPNGQAKKVWKIVSYPSMESSTPNYANRFYCLKADLGFSANNNTSLSGSKKIYNTKLNMKTQKDEVLTRLNAVNVFNNSQATYNKLLWIIDHMYLPGTLGAEQTKTQLLEDAEIIGENGYEEGSLLTDSDIEAVQQLVIWYFTNPNDANYNSTQLPALFFNNNSGRDENYDSLANLYDDSFENVYTGTIRQEQAGYLYEYLINGANENSNYTPQDQTSPISLQTGNFKAVQEGERYIIGPLNITIQPDRQYDITQLKFKDENGTQITLTGENKLLNQNKQVVTSGNIQDVIGQDFYISLPITTNIKQVNFSLNGSFNKTEATYYTTSEATYLQEQPVVLVEKLTQPIIGGAQVSIPEPKELDLALRKSITKINGQAPAINRLPQVDISKLQAGTSTTATYNHPKNDLETTTGSFIEYTINVCNEGEKDAYAAEIKDYLPTGIEFVELVSPKDKYAVTEEKHQDGTSTLTITNTGKTVLNKFSNGNLEHEAFTIRCKITLDPEKENVRLVNIAEITKYFDAESNIEKNTDRDSQIENFPDNKKNNTYTGNGKEGDYIPGQQDDDDFEPIVVVKKELDLALRKSITKINGQAPSVNRLPQVDISKLEAGTSTTATYNHPKNDLETTTGSIIEYTINVFNEGQRNAYAAEIKDYLPAGIEFVELVSPKDKYTVAEEKHQDGTSTLTITNTGKTVLNKFSNGNLEHEAFTIRCKITLDPEKENVRLVNIAEITKYFDAQSNIEKDIDRDSQIENFPDNKKNNTYTGNGKEGDYIPGQQDDDDFEPIVVVKKELDLALRKSITKINGQAPSVNRLPQVDISKLEAGTSTTATYNHPKNDLETTIGSIIEYTINVFNEGQRNAYAAEIKDYLPAGIEFVELVSPQDKYKAVATKNSNGTTTVTITNTGKTVLNKFSSGNLEYEGFTIRCRITAKASTTDTRLVNIAEITKYFDAQSNIEKDVDRDSQIQNFPSDKKNNSYTGNGKEGDYVPGQQDDDDFEPIVIPKAYFDLSLRKFISEVNDIPPKTNREPVVDISKLQAGTSTTAIYNHTKVPLTVRVGDIVTYTIRVYNEGQIDGYASQITDHLPEYLEFLPEDEQNIANGWMYDENDSTLRTIKTNHLSKEVDIDNMLKAFDGTTLSYKDVKVKCRIKNTAISNQDITNIADITEYTDEAGNKVPDRDSNEKNVELPSDEELPNYKDEEINKGDKYIPGQEDDDDFEKVNIQVFDLALRKFITKVDNKDVTNRIPNLSIDEKGNIKYTHTKEPVLVQTNNIVTYTLRIFNEGDTDGYAKEITDNLPQGLQFLPEHETNKNYRWIMLDKEGNKTTDITKATKITTDYLSKEQEKEEGQNLIKAYNKEAGITQDNPDYKDVKVAFKVVEPNTSDRILTNTAEISEDSDKEGKPVDDIDSTPDNNEPNEDDIDEEHVKLIYFDLALRKFITKVNNLDINNRVPNLSLDEKGNIKYTHTKEPVQVEQKDIVTYTLRIYNEGKIDGYAKEVTDNIPEGLEFLPEHETNQNYRWIMIDKEGNKTTDITKATKITTDYLSKEQEKEEGQNLIKAFDKKAGITDKNPDYKDVKVAFKVIEPNTSDRIIINTAEISEDSDKEDKPVDDVDSTPGNEKPDEDDIDIEKVKVKYFDLALKKWVSNVIIIEDGKQITTNTGHTGDENPEPVVKVDLKSKQLNKVTVKFGYKIKVTNEGQIEGYAKEVKDYIPDGLKFVQEDNPKWAMINEKEVVTQQLQNTLLKPGESATVDILLTWENSENNLGQKVNIAEISQHYNDSDTPDIDSTPNNKKPGEDDIDDAPVLLSVKTGQARLYIVLTTTILLITAVGVILIKKYII